MQSAYIFLPLPAESRTELEQVIQLAIETYQDNEDVRKL